ncbi:MAG: RecX family transcriptional regulator [Chloroflexi bacterium]|nr:RecX family transcriptional regulator [Chloroflexota bacterium]MCI0579371.1 RecX family transcriptional regulator [Chloroflexota bacterium]MCI0646219.1 RecX family transcriptional regulator [Chloroflexota bacterium]MCI0726924.1 RecX family transcriptional regulator [Chloroflexota bacterium]
MRKITALTPQKRDKERVNVYLDGEYAFGLALVTAGWLQVGQALSDEQIARLQADDTLERAKQSAYHFLSYRPRSLAEVRRNLLDKGFDDAVVDQALERLAELNLVDDQAFARYWVEQRETFKPRSRLALRQELRQKGLSREEIDEALADVDEPAAAYKAGQKKATQWAHLPEAEFLIKMGRFLQRRGFSYATVEDVAREIWEGLHNQNDETDRDSA